MLSSIVGRLQLYLARKKWRKSNAHNDTYMGEYFEQDMVTVGKASYGLLNVISHGTDSHLYIGNYCSIAPDVVFVLNGEHAWNCISTVPFKTHIAKNQKFEAGSNGNIVIEDDVWIGTGAKIMSGVCLHQGCVVAAGAVVTKDVEGYSVVGGVPAKVIKKRFDEPICEKLMEVDFSQINEAMVEQHLDDLYEPLVHMDQLKWLPKKNNRSQ